MFKKTIIAAAIASATLMASTVGASAMTPTAIATVQTAVETGATTGTGGQLINAGFRRRHRHFHRFHRWNRPVYYRGCYWLKRKARRTGSRYWFKRYQDCKYGYGHGYRY